MVLGSIVCSSFNILSFLNGSAG